MNKKWSLFLVPTLVTILACASLSKPFQNREGGTPYEEPIDVVGTSGPTPTTNPLANTNICGGELVITGIDEIDLGDGTKIVHVKIGFQNIGTYWAKVRGPDDDEDTASQKSVFITTKNGSVYGFMGRAEGGLPLQVLPDRNLTLYERRGAVITALIPPGFSIQGQTMVGSPHYYGFAFQMPSMQVPDTLTIRNMTLGCIVPENQKSTFIDLVETYDLNDVSSVNPLPSTDKYPELIGSKLDMSYVGERIEFTRVIRNGNTVSVFFDYTNLSTNDAYPGFYGYIIGKSQLASCQAGVEVDCENTSGSFGIVQPGQTAKDLVATFIVPENETDLIFVYVEGDIGSLNRVYRISSIVTAEVALTQATNQVASDTAATDSLCKNDYFPVVKGAQWLHKYTIYAPNAQVIYALMEIGNVFSEGFDYIVKYSSTTDFSSVDSTLIINDNGTCSSEGVTSTSINLSKEIPAGTTWTRGFGGEVIYTTLGIEFVTVPAGTFEAVKIKQDRGYLGSDANFSFLWYAKGIGLLKTDDYLGTQVSMSELVAYSIP